MEGTSAQEEKQQWQQQGGRQRGPRGSSRPPTRQQQQSDHQEAWDQRRRSPSKKSKGKQDVWKDVLEHNRNVPKRGAVGSPLPDEAVPLPAWPARPDNWPTKGQLDDEATFYIDRIPVKDVEWVIQQSDSHGASNKVWPNNTQKSLHPSQKTWRKTTLALVRWCMSISEHECYVASKAERLAKKMASMTVPSGASAASSAADAAAEKKPKLKKRSCRFRSSGACRLP